PVVDVATGREIRRLTNPSDAHDQTVTCVAFSPDGRTLAWAGPEDGSIQLVEIATGRKRHQLAGHRGRVQSLAFAPGGEFLVSGAYDTTALVWNLAGPLNSEQRGRLSERTLLSCWEALAKEDASLAYSALRKLTADPRRSVPFFARRLRPAAALDQRLLARLIDDLDSDEFAVREKATKELHELGEDVFPELRKALEAKPSNEVRSRIAQVMEKPEGWSPQRLRALRAIEALEH